MRAPIREFATQPFSPTTDNEIIIVNNNASISSKTFTPFFHRFVRKQPLKIIPFPVRLVRIHIHTHIRVFIWIRHLDDDGEAAARVAFFHFSTDFCMAQVMRARDHSFPFSPLSITAIRTRTNPFEGTVRRESLEDLDPRRGKGPIGEKGAGSGNRCFSRWRTTLPPTVHTSKQDNPFSFPPYPSARWIASSVFVNLYSRKI